MSTRQTLPHAAAEAGGRVVANLLSITVEHFFTKDSSSPESSRRDCCCVQPSATAVAGLSSRRLLRRRPEIRECIPVGGGAWLLMRAEVVPASWSLKKVVYPTGAACPKL